MSATDSVDSLSITSPCTSDWDEMIGTDQVRFCRHCSLNVHNISEMNRNQAARLIARSKGRLCLRYYRTSQGEVVTRPRAPRLVGISRRASRIAASAFGAALTVSNVTIQNAPAATNSASGYSSFQNPTQNGTNTGGLIIGTITDPMGAAIHGASVALLNRSSSFVIYASTDDRGEFKFQGLAAGPYAIRIEAPNFEAIDGGIVFVQADGETRFDRIMRIASIEASTDVESREIVTMGAVAVVAPEDPFIKAAQEDNLAEVESLIAGVDVNLRDSRSGGTALEYAVRNANREMVQLLLSRGADVNLQDPGGQTVLMMLDENATSDLVWDLINAGAKLELKDQNGDTAVIEAATVNNVEVLKALLEAGAKVDAKNTQRETALIKAASNGYINNVRTLVLAGADIADCDASGKNVLWYATDNNQSAVIRFLRSRGAFASLIKTEREE